LQQLTHQKEQDDDRRLLHRTDDGRADGGDGHKHLNGKGRACECGSKRAPRDGHKAYEHGYEIGPALELGAEKTRRESRQQRRPVKEREGYTRPAPPSCFALRAAMVMRIVMMVPITIRWRSALLFQAVSEISFALALAARKQPHAIAQPLNLPLDSRLNVLP